MEGSLKGVILAGGSGTRLHPLTRITNKHLLPVYDRPMVTYAIEALVKAGVTELDGDRVVRIVEKPAEPPSEYAVTGIYFYDEQVWDVLPTLRPSGRGELEITDVNNWYVEQGAMEYDVLEGFWGDAGESIDAYYAVNDFVRHNGVNR